MNLNEINELIQNKELDKYEYSILLFDDIIIPKNIEKRLLKKNVFIARIQKPTDSTLIQDYSRLLDPLINHLNDYGVEIIRKEVQEFIFLNKKNDINKLFRIFKWRKKPLSIVEKSFDKYKKPLHSLIHLSDLHLGIGEQNDNLPLLKKQLETRMKYLNDVRFVVTGDIVDIVNDENNKNATLFKSYLSSLSRHNVIFVHGNHDVDIKGIAITSKRRRVTELTGIYPDIKIVENCKLIFILLNSNSPGVSFAKGKIGEQQLEIVTEKLKEVKKTLNIDEYTLVIVMHHHLFSIDKPNEFKKKKLLDKIQGEATLRLVDSDLLIKWMKDNNVHYVLHGHKHIPYVTYQEGINVISCGSSLGQGSPYLNYNVVNITNENPFCLQYLVRGKNNVDLNIYQLNNQTK